MDGKRFAEAVCLTLVGGALGAGTGWVAGRLTPDAVGVILAVVGAIAGATNGAVSGYLETYDWSSWTGWASFLADSTWALFGTLLGLVVIQLVNAFRPEAGYRSDLCRRKNFHLYARGMRLRPGFAFTLGNVTSNGETLRGHIRQAFIMNHEFLHVSQSRLFGPLFQAVYLVWGALGTVVGFVVWLTDRSVSLVGLIQTAAYYDNPFEYWAYRNDDHWRPGGVIAKLAWPDVR